MGFEAKDSGALQWTDATEKNGTATYSDLTVNGKDGKTINIGTLTLTGVHMAGEDPSFDRIDMFDVTIDEDDSTGSIGRLSLSNPAPKLAASIIKLLENVDDLNDIDLEVGLEDHERAFGAIFMDDLKVKSDEASVSLATLGWGENDNTNKGLFLLEDLAVEAKDKKSETPVNISLGSLSGTGINMDYFRDVSEMAKAEGKSKKDGKKFNFNPLQKTFDEFSLSDFSLTADNMNLVSDGIVGKSTQKGDVMTISQAINPFKLFFAGEAQDPKFGKLQEALASVGFEEIEVSGGSTSTLNAKTDSFAVSDSYITVKDAFDLNFAYSGSGLKSVAHSLEKIDPETEPTDADIEAMLENVYLNDFEMSLTDNSLIDKVLTIVADKQGTTPALIKMQAKGGLMMLGMAAKTEAQGEALMALSTALGAFIDNGGTLKVSLNPETPIPGAELKDLNPATLDPSALGFTVEHQP